MTIYLSPHGCAAHVVDSLVQQLHTVALICYLGQLASPQHCPPLRFSPQHCPPLCFSPQHCPPLSSLRSLSSVIPLVHFLSSIISTSNQAETLVVIGEFAAASSLLSDLQAAVLATQHTEKEGMTSDAVASRGESQGAQEGVTSAGDGGNAASDGAWLVGQQPWGRMAVRVEEVRGE